MVVLRFPIGSTQVQVDDFGPGVERSCKGALHFHPGSVKEVTLAEWEHIRKKHPDTASRFQVLTAEVPTPRPARLAISVEKVEAAPLPAAEPEPVRNEEVNPEGNPTMSRPMKRRLRHQTKKIDMD
jgi:hypothetical protein